MMPKIKWFSSLRANRIWAVLLALAISTLFIGSAWRARAAASDPSSINPLVVSEIISQVAKLDAGDAQVDDSFGVRVAIYGDTLVVGANGEDGGPGDPASAAGAAYVFERVQGGADNWGQVKKLTASDAQASDLFGGRVAINRDTIVVAATSEDGGPGDPAAAAGAADVFERDQGGADNWGHVKNLTASDAEASDNFGWSVAISKHTIVVGAWREDGGPGDPTASAGAAYVFDHDQGGAGNWGEVKKLTAFDAQAYDNFGFSVSIYLDKIVVGATGEDYGLGDAVDDAGAVYIYARDLGGVDNWGMMQKRYASDAQVNDSFGTSVAISGDTVVVATYWEDGGPGDPLNKAGAAYVLERDQGGVDQWGEVTKLTASDAQEDDRFGISVAISADTIVVGAYREDYGPGDPVVSAGAAYVFARDQGGVENWGEVTKLTASDAQPGDQFGFSVSIDVDTLVVGANLEDGGPGDPVEDAGAAYVFQQFPGGTIYLPIVVRP